MFAHEKFSKLICSNIELGCCRKELVVVVLMTTHPLVIMIFFREAIKGFVDLLREVPVGVKGGIWIYVLICSS